MLFSITDNPIAGRAKGAVGTVDVFFLLTRALLAPMARPHGGDPVHGAGAIVLHEYFHRGGSGGSWTAVRAQRSRAQPGERGLKILEMAWLLGFGLRVGL